MFKNAYVAGTEAALVKFALSPGLVSRAIMNKATQTGARVAPNLLNSISGNKPALMSLAKNVRAPGGLTPTAPQNSLNKMMNKFDFFGGEMNEHGANQLPALRNGLGRSGRIYNTGGPLALEQNITKSFGPRPAPPVNPKDLIGTVAGTPKKNKQMPGLQPRV